MRKIMRKLMFGGLTSVLFALAALMLLLPVTDSVRAAGSDIYKQLNLFGDVFERIRTDYVEEVQETQMIEAAINGMLTSLDPHSSFLNAKAFSEMQVQTRGEFGGLGIEVTMENGLVKVITPIDDTPAARAGIRTGDLIVQIDTKPVMGLTLQEAVELMRGPVNSSIALTIQRAGQEKPIDVKVTRAIIKVQSVRSRREGNIGYVRITTFNEQAEGGLVKAMETLRSQIGKDKVQGFVLDLRNNSGGLLDQAISISDSFLNQGEIVSTRGRRQGDVQRFNARRGDLADGKPMVVIINGGSASASEIVAGALQDHRRAIVLGTKSFGKGSVQTIIPLQGQGALRLTTARYYTPSGRSIQAKGIEPDIDVQPSKIEAVAEAERRKEADLPKHLANPNSGSPAPAVLPPPLPVPPAPGVQAPTDGAAPPTDPITGEVDYQLLRALDLLRGLSLISAGSSN